jgi:hypothetical protein
MPGEEEGEGAEQEGTGLMAVYFGQVARETMRSTQKMAVHNQLKLYVPSTAGLVSASGILIWSVTRRSSARAAGNAGPFSSRDLRARSVIGVCTVLSLRFGDQY